MLVAEESFGGRVGRVDDVADHCGSLARIASSTPAAGSRSRLLHAAEHVRAAALVAVGLVTRTDLRLDRLDHRLEARALAHLHSTRTRDSTWAFRTDRPDVKIKNHGSGHYGTEPHYSTLPFWQLCALKG